MYSDGSSKAYQGGQIWEKKKEEVNLKKKISSQANL